MTRFGWLVVSGVVLAALGIALLLWGFARQSSPDLADEAQRTAVVDPSTLSIYTSGAYGFTFLYPAAAQITDSFEGRPTPWREHALATGTPIVHIMLARGEVRIGTSGDERAVAACLEEGPSETKRDPLTVGDATWQVFTFDELGTDNEQRVTSYRIVHEDRCVALETFVPLPAPADGLPTEDPSFIVRNFTFAR